MQYKNTLLAGALFLTGALFADQSQVAAQSQKSCVPKCPPKSTCIPDKKAELKPAYNASALNGNNCSYGFSLSASFLYWSAQQDGMDIAIQSAQIPGPYVLSVQNASYKFQETAYKPGFKLGFGWKGPYDWSWSIDYTYFHSKTSTSTGLPPSDIRGSGVWSLSDWYGIFYPFTTTSISSTWHANLDMIDGLLSYPYYQGRMLTVVPYLGLRTFWLHQNMKLSCIMDGAAVQPAVSHNKSHAWDIGPVAGLDSQWLFGKGFRLEGDVEASLLYNHFKVKHSDNANVTATPDLTVGGSSLKFKQNTLRPMAAMGLGLGWGGGQEYHFDLLVKYDFMMFWSQNAMRTLINAYTNGNGNVAFGDFTLQGLTITALFDF